LVKVVDDKVMIKSYHNSRHYVSERA